jgi:hypothetical protein
VSQVDEDDDQLSDAEDGQNGVQIILQQATHSYASHHSAVRTLLNRMDDCQIRAAQQHQWTACLCISCAASPQHRQLVQKSSKLQTCAGQQESKFLQVTTWQWF